MISDRLSHLQTEVQAYYEQLAGKEKAKRLAEQAEKVRIQQQIDELRQELGQVEREYWQRWSKEIAGLTIPEAEAEAIAVQIVQEVEILEFEPKVQQNVEMLKLLQDIKAALNKPEALGAGKLKAAIPLLPGIISYEMELDTEGLLRRIFPTFCKLGDKLKK